MESEDEIRFKNSRQSSFLPSTSSNYWNTVSSLLSGNSVAIYDTSGSLLPEMCGMESLERPTSGMNKTWLVIKPWKEACVDVNATSVVEKGEEKRISWQTASNLRSRGEICSEKPSGPRRGCQGEIT